MADEEPQLTGVSRRDRLLAGLVESAPLWGFPLWLVELNLPSNSWNFALIPALGFFMFLTGLAIPVVALACKGFVRIHVRSALRFHGWIALGLVLFAVAFCVSIFFDPVSPTMSNPPAAVTGVLVITAIFTGLILPLVEFGRSMVCGVRAWRGYD